VERRFKAAARLAGLLLLAASAGSAVAAQPCDLDYRVQVRTDVQPAALEVELRFAAEGRRESWLRVQSSWAGVEDYPLSYGNWQALGEGQAVQAEAGTARVRIQHGPQDEVRLRWRVRSSLADPEAVLPQKQEQMYRSQVGARGYQFFGYGMFPSVEQWGDERQARICLSLQPFDARSPAFGTPGKSAPGEALQWRFTGSHAQLRHAFYASGPMWRLLQRPVQGGRLDLALRGSFTQLEDEAFADASARLVDVQRRFWGEASSANQWLVLTPNYLPGGNNGGTLVERVAVLHVPQDFSTRDSSFEFLVAHENLHQWFPHRFGAHGAGQSGESDDDPRDVPHYWFSEGFTDHYSYRLLLASGLWDLDRYAAQLTQRVRDYLGSPTRRLSAAQIAPRFFSDRAAGRQMYLRGELLALRWDAALRRAGRSSLTALLQGLLLPTPQPGDAVAPRQAASERVLAELSRAMAGTGVDPRDELERYVMRGEALPLDAADTRWAPEVLSPCLTREVEPVRTWVLGFDRESLRTRVLQGVDPDGPAYAAGLRDGMALAGFSIHGGDLNRDAELLIKDEGADKPRKLSYRPVSRDAKPMPRWRAKADAAVDPVCRAWMTAL
jgi:predicted metalloprotease with PDZ domain